MAVKRCSRRDQFWICHWGFKIRPYGIQGEESQNDSYHLSDIEEIEAEYSDLRQAAMEYEKRQSESQQECATSSAADCEPLSAQEKREFGKLKKLRDNLLIERKEVGEEIRWFVNGVDKGRFFVRSNTLKAKIIEALYDQIGRGWVPHKSFIIACAWTEQEYFGSSDNLGDPGRMQRQLTNIRNFLGVTIEFRKNKGVRFAENVVKSK